MEYEYYVIQVGALFVANRYCEEPYTDQEELAFAYSTMLSAKQANTMQGIIKKRVVMQDELEAIEVDEQINDQFALFSEQLVG